MKRIDFLRKPLMLILAAAISIGLVFSIPLLNFIGQGGVYQEQRRKTEVAIIRQEKRPEQPVAKREARRPERMQMRSRSIKSGPRFAMDLGVAGVGGVSIPADLVTQSAGKERETAGDVDQRPQGRQMPDLEIPPALREKEQNASVLLSFCVDQSGTPYDLRISEEKPAGMGLAEAARAALSRVRFEPARKGGQPVAFCGMEQPFEVLFTN